MKNSVRPLLFLFIVASLLIIFSDSSIADASFYQNCSPRTVAGISIHIDHHHATEDHAGIAPFVINANSLSCGIKYVNVAKFNFINKYNSSIWQPPKRF